jgi:polysaccharide export outer membrane protein
MSSKVLLFLGLLICGCEALPAYTPPGQEAENGYVIGPGDVLIISLWKDEALTREVTVLPDGTISFPLVGEIQSAGKKVSALEKDIKDRIKRYVPDPVLTVMVKDVNSMSFFVIGRVNKPGQYPLPGTLNVLQGLATAGGPTPFADTGNIKVFRSLTGSPSVMKFDYDDVAKGKHLEQNITLERGDVIIVP